MHNKLVSDKKQLFYHQHLTMVVQDGVVVCAKLTLKLWIFMAALRSRCGHYIFVLFLLSIFLFSSPNLSRRSLDVYHTSTHGVALVQI